MSTMDGATPLDPFELWMLSHLVSLCVHLGTLGDPDYAAIMNAHAHGRDRAGTTEGIRRLLARGLVEVVRSPDGQQIRREELSDADLDIALDESTSVPWPERHLLGLTAAGGAAWEEWMRPHWPGFVTLEPREGADQWTVRGVRRANVLSYAELLADLHSVAAPDHEGVRAIDGWEPTYWKKLPSGVELDMLLPELPRRFTSMEASRRQNHLELYAKNWFHVSWRFLGW